MIYALLCGEKLSQKLCLWRKKDKYHVCAVAVAVAVADADADADADATRLSVEKMMEVWERNIHPAPAWMHLK